MGSVTEIRNGKLTNREREVLYWASEGKTAWETSVILSISETTVISYLKRARYKLDTTNVVHTIVEALRRCEIKL